MTARRWLRAALALAAGLVLLQGTAQARPDLAGVWRYTGDGDIRPVDGGPIPLLPAAAKTYADNQAKAKAGDFSFDSAARCWPQGVPRLLYTPGPFQLLQTPTRVVLLHQVNHIFRLIPVDAAHLSDDDPRFVGNAVARYDGDALVIDTVQFKEGLLTRQGLPFSDALHVVERYSLAPGGKALRARVTLEDPKTFSRPWSFDIAFARQNGVRIEEDVCMDKDKTGRRAAR